MHGTRACYVLDRCRCLPCARDNARVEGIRIRQTAYGRWVPYVDAGPAREHVEQLRAAGMGLKLIAKAAGVPHGALAKLIYGEARRGLAPSKRIRPHTEAAILACHADLEHLGARVAVDATGVHRRLQALISLGWSQAELARRLGMSGANFGKVLQRPTCGASTALRVRRLYDEMLHQLPPETTRAERQVASAARNYAARRGWRPPMWWDVDDLDVVEPVVDEDEIVDEVAVERFVAGDDVALTGIEKQAAARELFSLGHSMAGIARRLHISADRVKEWVVQASLDEVAS